MGFGPGSAEGSVQLPTLTTHPRMVGLATSQQHFQHRQSVEPEHHGSTGGHGDGRRHSTYYTHSLPEALRPIDEDYDGGSMHGMPRRRGAQPEDFEMLNSPDIKRRRFEGMGRSPDHAYATPMGAVPHHPGRSGYPPQSPYPPQQYHQQHPDSRRGSAVGYAGGSYPSHPSGSYPMPAPLPQPRPTAGPSGASSQSQPQPQPQQMAPPPRPGRLSTASGVAAPSPPELPAKAGQPGFDASLTLAPLQIPPTSPTQTADTSGGARSLSSAVLSGLGAGAFTPTPGQWGDGQTRGVEALLLSIPYLNRLSALRRIEPPLGPPGPGGPGVETRGPVIAIEGTHEGLLRDVRPVVERALRESRECEVRIWTDSSVERALTPPDDSGSASKADQIEDVEMAGAQGKTTRMNGSRHNSIARTSDSTDSGMLGAHSVGASTATAAQQGGGPKALVDYLHTILRWHTKSAEIVKHITTEPAKNGPFKLIPVALIPGGFGLTLSDRAATTIDITDVYSPLDHWQWMASLWRGIVGADLVVYVREMTADEATLNHRPVEYHASGVMEVKVAGGKVDETMERRLAFEVMEWIMAGSFRDGYAFAGEGR
ncbi:hypothetical protein BD289DRAFT_30118 [Coniella lustricola]|uniref:Uncharacterized protein n=1 Tax=Coniella lustricola TaxID=2025994 RepID=A0A2T3AJE2_9PEZI|nr:hypothetical protein BD289DRAFT_30118 [Coniella lustricola]